MLGFRPLGAGPLGSGSVTVASSPVIDDINTNEIIEDGENGITFATTGFSGEITSARLQSGAFVTNGTNISSTSGDGTFDIQVISTGIYQTSNNCPFSTASHSVETYLSDGTDNNTLAVTYNPPTGYAVIEVTGVTNTAGKFSQSFDVAVPNTSQVLYPTADSTSVAANGDVTTSKADGILFMYYWDAVTGIWTRFPYLVAAQAIANDLNIGGWSNNFPFMPYLDGNQPSSLRSNAQFNISVDASILSGPAPLGVMFEGLSTTATTVTNEFDELYYSWDFDDVSSSFDNKPSDNANKSIGPVACHVFDTAGTYDVVLTVRDIYGNVDTETVQITVTDPDVVYSGNTYIVADDGDFTGAPTGTQINTATFLSNINGLTGASPDTRYLLKRGNTFNLDTTRIDIEDVTANVLIGAWGSGAKPKFTVSDSVTATLIQADNSDAVRITDIECEGVYDPTTGLNSKPAAIRIFNGSTNALVYKCKLGKLGMGVWLSNASGEINDFHHIVCDNEIYDWQDYGIFGYSIYCGIIGNSIRQNPAAVSGSEGKVGLTEPNYPDHGPIRLARTRKSVLANNDLFNNAGWSSAGLAHQPCMRLGTFDAEILDSVVYKNSMEGGLTVIGLVPASTGQISQVSSLIIDSNLLVATGNTRYHLDCQYSGTTVRNNLFYKTDNGTPLVGSGFFDGAIRYVADNPSAGNTAGNIKIHNNSMIVTSNAGVADDACLVDVTNTFENFDVKNNIVQVDNPANDVDCGLMSFAFAVDKNNIDEDYNIVYTPGNTNNYFYDNGTQRTLANWRSVTTNGDNSDTVDPLFVNTALTDGEIQSGSPARDSGVAVDGMYADYNDDVRATIDIGAVEYI